MVREVADESDAERGAEAPEDRRRQPDAATGGAEIRGGRVYGTRRHRDFLVPRLGMGDPAADRRPDEHAHDAEEGPNAA